MVHSHLQIHSGFWSELVVDLVQIFVSPLKSVGKNLRSVTCERTLRQPVIKVLLETSLTKTTVFLLFIVKAKTKVKNNPNVCEIKAILGHFYTSAFRDTVGDVRRGHFVLLCF